ncbi:hypothetical protein NAEGRDRAFT_81465 [Naegleria gruberi]|uniref:Protein kinase domain-containing protein n=1 Tax=Naegleria gruberi TaxID=5762 RepID=D2VWC1_NAEGR|nr:uncharacterized protein NAEGRDRAFT_81465 [Naegleria gruberi]EFC38807.1 hypothetical protein NAEGRDRAFT_81465 [Naegleria gruberi]|eukprot:XP_002671551.1 hypothetical protein NAEGRDRAFT_81465 [Naegleria gruberi strain NEG-M]
MSIVNQLVREGKVASFSASSVKDVSDHHLAVKSLAQLLTEEEEQHDAMNQPLSPNFLLVIVFKTVRLLDLLHKHHLVYRNLTLENILIEKLQDGNLNVHLNNLDKSIELLIDQQVNLTSTISFQGDEHAVSYNAPLHQYFDFNRNAQITHGYEPPEIIHSTTCEKPFICLKSEIWSLAICILRVLFRKSIIIHPENYVEQLDELFGREVDEDLVATQDESKTIMTCLKEMTRNMLCPNVYERWSCADVIEYICLASTFLKSITQEFLNQ